MELAFQTLHPDAVLPGYAHDGDAGLDLVAVEEHTLAPGSGRAVISTGLAVAIPEGFAGLILARSGLAARHGVTCANAPGLIDSGYRGEIRVAMVNHDPHEAYVVRSGDRIAQLIVVAVPVLQPRLVDGLPDAARGVGGFGSTGR